MEDDYQSVIIKRAYYQTMPDGFVPNESKLLAAMIKSEGAKWAIDNSIDGLHIYSERHLIRHTIAYRLDVLLPKEKATFWKLKFNGR